MGIIKRRFPWKKRPSFPVKNNLSKPFTSSLLYSSVFSGSGYDASGRNSLPAKTSGISFTKDGLVTDGTAGQKITLDRSLDFSSNKATVIFRVKHNPVSGVRNGGIVSDKNVANWESAVGFSINLRADGGLLFRVGTAGTSTVVNYFDDLQYHDVIVRWEGGVLAEIYVDGEEVTYTGNTVASSHTTAAIPTRLGVYYDEALNRSLNGGLEYIHVFNDLLPLDVAKEITRNPYQLLQPQTRYLTTSTAISATLTGTATATIDEDDVVLGGTTSIYTLTGDTFIAAGTGPIGTIAQSNAFIAAAVSAQNEAIGWNNEVTGVLVRTADNVATITWSASANYDITAQETITSTIPAAVLTTSTVDVEATPDFTVDQVVIGGIAVFRRRIEARKSH